MYFDIKITLKNNHNYTTKQVKSTKSFDLTCFESSWSLDFESKTKLQLPS